MLARWILLHIWCALIAMTQWKVLAIEKNSFLVLIMNEKVQNINCSQFWIPSAESKIIVYLIGIFDLNQVTRKVFSRLHDYIKAYTISKFRRLDSFVGRLQIFLQRGWHGYSLNPVEITASRMRSLLEHNLIKGRVSRFYADRVYELRGGESSDTMAQVLQVKLAVRLSAIRFN